MKADKKAQANMIHIIAGIILIASGVLFLINKSSLGVVFASISLLMEALKNWVK